MQFNNIQLFSEKKDVQKMLQSGADLILLDEKELEKFKHNKLEILDIYTANNHRVGAASRKAYIQLGLITHAVHLFIFNENDEVFLQMRAPDKDIYPNYYAPSVAGHVGLGETSETSAYREMREEIGLDTPLTFLGSFKCFQPENVVNQFYDFYIGVSSESITLDKHEASGGEFFSWRNVCNQMDWNLFIFPLRKEIEIFGLRIESELQKRKKSV